MADLTGPVAGLTGPVTVGQLGRKGRFFKKAGAVAVDGPGRPDAVTADDFTETLQGFFIMMPVFQPGSEEGLLRGDGIRGFEAEPQGDDSGLHFKGIEVSADEAEKHLGIERRLG